MCPFPLVRSSCPLSAGVLHVLPDVSMERDVLHVHLLLCHLVPRHSLLLYMLYINTYCITVVFALSSHLSPGANPVKESTVYVYLKLFYF